MDKIKKYNLFGEYIFGNIKGKQEGTIYLNSDNNFIGKILDSNETFMTCGNLIEENFRLLKFPNSSKYFPVYWSLNKKDHLFEGDFYFIPLNIKNTLEMFNSLENSLKNFDKGIPEKLDQTTKNLFNYFGEMDKSAKDLFKNMNDLDDFIKKNFELQGSGKIILANVLTTNI